VRRRFYVPPFLLSITLVLACSLVSLGQTTRDKFVISAKAGAINAITGGANVSSRGDSNWQQLMITDDLNSGDRVRTDYDGRVEILLNPGAYLRLGGNSEIELVDNSLANLEVRLLRGTAIVEATGADGLELNIGISTPHTRLAIVRQGLYRLNVIPEDATELIVRKGSVILSDTHTKVKGGNKVIFNATNVSVAKLSNADKKKDDMEVWSKDRAKTLAQANSRITNRVMNTAFASFRDPFRDPFFPFDSRALGLWFFNPRVGCYTFLPYYLGLGSPYGSVYTTAFYLPYVPGNPYPYIFSRPGTAVSSGGQYYPTSGQGSPNSGGSSNNTGGSRPPTPPPPANSGGFGNGGNGGFGREPRMINPETGNPAPRKNLEKMPGQP
jgi:FecR protein